MGKQFLVNGHGFEAPDADEARRKYWAVFGELSEDATEVKEADLEASEKQFAAETQGGEIR